MGVASEGKPFIPLLGGCGGSDSEPVATCSLGSSLHERCLDSAPGHPLSVLDNHVLNK